MNRTGKIRFRFLALLLLCAGLCHSRWEGPWWFWGCALASDNEKYLQEWVSTDHLTKVSAPRMDHTKVGHPLHISFITSFFTVINDSLDVSVDVRIVQPDGSTMMDENNWAHLGGGIETNQTFVIFPRVLDLTFESSDPKGTYQIISVFRDLSSGRRRVTDTLAIRLF